MTISEHAEAILAKLGVDVNTLPDRLLSTYLAAIGENIGSGGGGSGAQSDWLAAEGEPGHVLNRTHYDENSYILPEMEAVFPSEQPMALVTFLAPPIIGETYTINFGGTVYQSVAGVIPGMDGGVGLGNGVAFGGEDNGEPFFAMYTPEASAFLAIDGRASATISVFGRRIKKLAGELIETDGLAAEIIPLLDLTGLQTEPLGLTGEQNFDLDDETALDVSSKISSGIVRVKVNVEHSYKSNGNATTSGSSEVTVTMTVQTESEYYVYLHGFVYQKHLAIRCTGGSIAIGYVNGDIIPM